MVLLGLAPLAHFSMAATISQHVVRHPQAQASSQHREASGRSENTAKLAAIASAVQQAIREGRAPGAVVVIGHDGRIAYRRAFGDRSVVPRPSPMRADTIFDVASLTKVIV